MPPRRSRRSWTYAHATGTNVPASPVLVDHRSLSPVSDMLTVGQRLGRLRSMSLATVNGEAVEFLLLLAASYAALGVAFIALGRFARRMWARAEVPQTVLARLGQLVLCGL